MYPNDFKQKEGLAMKSNALELVMCPENEKAFRIHQGAIYLNGRRLKVVTIEVRITIILI